MLTENLDHSTQIPNILNNATAEQSSQGTGVDKTFFAVLALQNKLALCSCLLFYHDEYDNYRACFYGDFWIQKEKLNIKDKHTWGYHLMNISKKFTDFQPASPFPLIAIQLTIDLICIRIATGMFYSKFASSKTYILFLVLLFLKKLMYHL